MKKKLLYKINYYMILNNTNLCIYFLINNNLNTINTMNRSNNFHFFLL